MLDPDHFNKVAFHGQLFEDFAALLPPTGPVATPDTVRKFLKFHVAYRFSIVYDRRRYRDLGNIDPVWFEILEILLTRPPSIGKIHHLSGSRTETI